MRIAVTGSSKLAGFIVNKYKADSIRVEQEVDKNNYDVFINNAHVGFSQSNLLYEWFDCWKDDPSKLIINVSSRAGLSNLSVGYLYAAQKASLDHLSDNLVYNSHKRCRITTLNLGLLEDKLPSVKYEEVGHLLDFILSLPQHLEIPRVFLQHSENYKVVQNLKKLQLVKE